LISILNGLPTKNIPGGINLKREEDEAGTMFSLEKDIQP
jgi:hypothetical protein